MIEIQGIGIYDETKSFDEQPSASVGTYLHTIAESFNDLTAVERDQWNRPIKWQQVIDGVTIQSTRTYKTQDFNYFIELQENTVIDGNI